MNVSLYNDHPQDQLVRAILHDFYRLISNTTRSSSLIAFISREGMILPFALRGDRGKGRGLNDIVEDCCYVIIFKESSSLPSLVASKILASNFLY